MTPLTQLERRDLAKLTVPHATWIEILKETHLKETYDNHDIPQHREEVKSYLTNHPVIKNYIPTEYLFFNPKDYE